MSREKVCAGKKGISFQETMLPPKIRMTKKGSYPDIFDTMDENETAEQFAERARRLVRFRSICEEYEIDSDDSRSSTPVTERELPNGSALFQKILKDMASEHGSDAETSNGSESIGSRTFGTAKKKSPSRSILKHKRVPSKLSSTG